MNLAFYRVKSSSLSRPRLPDHTNQNPRNGSSSGTEKIMETVKIHCFQGGTRATIKSNTGIKPLKSFSGYVMVSKPPQH